VRLQRLDSECAIREPATTSTPATFRGPRGEGGGALENQAEASPRRVAMLDCATLQVDYHPWRDANPWSVVR
jgi:hypothetical protein